MPGDLSISDKLRAERDNLLRFTNWTYDRCISLTERALAEHIAGNEHEARVLLNEALDLEYKVSGDCKVLSQLAEEWRVDNLLDRRK